MKLKIKVKVFKSGELPKIISKGDWIDLKAAETVKLTPPTLDKDGNIVVTDFKVNLGVAMKLPDGFEAIINDRSSTYLSWGIIMSNLQGVIDNAYSGDDDEWKFVGITLGKKRDTIKKGDRICQFRIQLSQKATMWQKLKWLFSSGIEFEQEKHLSAISRGGFGITGTN
jgi:dUTP pyrophosphatase